jgi:hypothetical protein
MPSVRFSGMKWAESVKTRTESGRRGAVNSAPAERKVSTGIPE